jgi:hypothetical protein
MNASTAAVINQLLKDVQHAFEVSVAVDWDPISAKVRILVDSGRANRRCEHQPR